VKIARVTKYDVIKYRDLLRRDTCLLDDRHPFCELRPDELAERFAGLSGVIGELRTEFGEALVNHIVLQCGPSGSVEPGQDGWRCSFGREQRVPAGGLELRQSLFRGGRDVRNDGHASRYGDHQALDLPGLDVRHDAHGLIADIFNLSAKQRIEGWPGATERNVLRAHAQERVQEEAGKMRGRADPAGASNSFLAAFCFK